MEEGKFLDRTVNTVKIIGKLGVNVCSACVAYSVVDDVDAMQSMHRINLMF